MKRTSDRPEDGQLLNNDIVMVSIEGDEPARATIEHAMNWKTEAYLIRFIDGLHRYQVTHCRREQLELLERLDPKTGLMIPVSVEAEEGIDE